MEDKDRVDKEVDSEAWVVNRVVWVDDRVVDREA